MRFCDVCDNMMYLNLDENDELFYRCKNCHHAVASGEGMAGGTAPCVFGNKYIDDETKYRQFINPNIKFDPTLPRMNTIKCVNAKCTKPTGSDEEVIPFKYDRQNMRFMYYCCFCETFWKKSFRTDKEKQQDAV